MKIALLGDIGLFGRFCVTKNNDIKKYFSDVANLLSDYDLVIGNLETPFSEHSKPFGAKSAHIFSNKENVEILKYLNIEYVNLSNNHTFDFGLDSYETTKSVLSTNNIKYFGVESNECLIEKDGVKVALHGYCSFNTNPQMITFDKGVGINGLDVDIVSRNLKKNADMGYLNIVSIHSGQEHVNYPSLDDIQLARHLADIVPYIYYGHHPHVVQGIEKYKESILSYSLGNFCFSDIYTNKSSEPLIRQTQNNKTGLILSIEFDGSKIVKFETIPIYMGQQTMLLGHSNVECDLDTYSEALNLENKKYNEMRIEFIKAYLKSREKLRDFKWFVKRLNLNSLRQLLMIKKNRHLYSKHVKSKLD